MKRYAISEWENEDSCMEQGGLEEAGEWGDYCLYEEAHQVEVDRDIKAANLQLLVEKVLAAVPCIDDVADCAELRALEELARSLKQ